MFGLRMLFAIAVLAYDYLFSPPSVWYNQRVVGVSMCTLVTKRIGGTDEHERWKEWWTLTKPVFCYISLFTTDFYAT